MANFATYGQKVLSVEGGYTVDQGGHTNKGITLKTFMLYGSDNNHDGKIDLNDLLNISDAEALSIYKKQYWDYFNADKIRNQSLADIIVDWGINSGQAGAAQRVNKILGINSKSFGGSSLAKVNSANSAKLHAAILKARKDYYYYLAFKSQKRHLYRDDYNGWMNRLKKFTYKPDYEVNYTPSEIQAKQPYVNVGINTSLPSQLPNVHRPQYYYQNFPYEPQQAGVNILPFLAAMAGTGLLIKLFTNN